MWLLVLRDIAWDGPQRAFEVDISPSHRAGLFVPRARVEDERHEVSELGALDRAYLFCGHRKSREWRLATSSDSH